MILLFLLGKNVAVGKGLALGEDVAELAWCVVGEGRDDPTMSSCQTLWPRPTFVSNAVLPWSCTELCS